MPFLASDVMDQACIFLNDVSKQLYTYSAQLPYCIRANEDLEKKLLTFGVSIQSKVPTVINYTANSAESSLTLPSDFLLPVRLFERASGGVDADWVMMYPRNWNPEAYTAVNTLNYWAFRDNSIRVPGCTQDREIYLEYSRRLATISSQSSPEDNEVLKGYLSARTAELCARYVGMNVAFADTIKAREVDTAEDDLMRIYVLNNQGTPRRRVKFNTKRLEIY